MKNFIITWNNKYRFDYLYRRKHNIPFMGSEHRALTPTRIMFDLLEDKMIQEAIRKSKEQKVNSEINLFKQAFGGK